MKQRYMKRVIAFVMAFALVVTGSGLSAVLNSAAASAAKKTKVTLKLNKSKVNVKVGKTTTLKITKKNVKKIKSQKWTTSKKSVATVSKKGKVTAKKAGKATIKVKVKYIAKGSKKAKSKTLKCTVTVKDDAVATQPPAATATATETPVPEQTPFKFKSNDTSNIGEPREVTIVGGTSDKMTVKDNGDMRKELSSQYLVDNEMGLGINLGNTMEATITKATRLEYAKNNYEGVSATVFETAWGAAVTTQEYMDCLHSYGINTVRIPVAWSNMDSEDGTYTINEKYLGRVEEIVNYALNNGMYVIVNDHWDNGWYGQFGACKRNEAGEKIADEERRAEAWKRYESYWKQISERFKDYSDHLILESANEELGNRLNDAICPHGYSPSTGEEAISGNLKTAQQYEMVNEINQKFVDIVRASGGNNANRHLLIAGFNTNFENTADARFVMPKDTDENGKTKLFLSVHGYNPWNFCGDGMRGKYTDADKQGIENTYKSLTRFHDEGYAFIIGETGVVSPLGVDISERTVAERFRDEIEIGAPYHALMCFWETGQYFDRKECKLKFKDIAELFNELTGSNGDTSMTGLTGAQNNEGSILDVSGKTPVWSWSGTWYKNGGDSKVGDDRYEENGGHAGETPEDFASGEITSTIDGDATAITFDPTGYHAHLKLDLSKYKRPAIKFTFADNSLADPEELIGALQLGPNSDEGFAESLLLDFADFNGKAIVLEDSVALTEAKPWLSISFKNKPTITKIEIYEMG